MSEKSRFQITLGMFFVIPGIMMIVGSGITFNNTQDFIKNSSSTTGKVIELKTKVKVEKSKRSVTYLPIFNYQTPNGQTIKIESDVSSNPPEFSVGQQVNILYNPNNPYEAKIDSFSSLWLLPTILLGIGVIFNIVGLILHFNNV